jgi:hypothetical protein
VTVYVWAATVSAGTAARRHFPGHALAPRSTSSPRQAAMAAGPAAVAFNFMS